jgi:hypothetical protein
MKYTSREFVSDSYDRYDSWARDLFGSFLRSRGHSIINVEDYRHDIRSVKDGELFLFELEVKTRRFTCMEDFPFSTVSFLARKKRLHDMAPFWYVIISYESRCAVCCHSSVIFGVEPEDVDVSSPERPGCDQFYRVDKTKCYFFDV